MTNTNVAHLEVSILANRHGHVGLLLVEAGAVHSDARLVSLEEKIFLCIVLFYSSSLLTSTYLEDVPDGHGGHVDHDQADVPVRQLLRRLREQQRPLLGEVRHACTKIFSNSRKIFVVSKLAELDQVSDVDPAHLLHRHLVPLVDQTVVGFHEPVRI